MERKLCSIQRIDRISPIEGADRIEKLNILGWELVAEKGLYKEGDLVIYCEIDTILPEIPETEFMRKHNFRIRTIKLRGQVSQGLVLPLKLIDITEMPQDALIGINVTELIGARKYEAPIPPELSGQMKGSFPSFIPKTDEERIQAIPQVLELFKGTPIYFSEKLDGTSFTCYFNNGEFGVCTRNMELERIDNTQWKLVVSLDLENKLKEFGKNIAVQGEIMGEGIQNNSLKLKGHKLFVYNVFDIDAQEYLDYESFIYFCHSCRLDTVPIFNDDITLGYSLQELLTMATGPSLINPDVSREGIVIRSRGLVSQKYIDIERGIEKTYKKFRLSFKVLSNEYLLTHDE